MPLAVRSSEGLGSGVWHMRTLAFVASLPERDEDGKFFVQAPAAAAWQEPRSGACGSSLEEGA